MKTKNLELQGGRQRGQVSTFDNVRMRWPNAKWTGDRRSVEAVED